MKNYTKVLTISEGHSYNGLWRNIETIKSSYVILEDGTKLRRKPYNGCYFGVLKHSGSNPNEYLLLTYNPLTRQSCFIKYIFE